MAEPSKRGFRRAVIVLAVIGGLVVVGTVVSHAIGIVYLVGQKHRLKEVAYRDASGPAHLTPDAIEGLVAPDAPIDPPQVRILDPSGREIGLDAFRGKVVVVNLWAMWCAPCREEMPTLATLQAAYDPVEVIVVAINVDGDPAQEKPARAFLAQHPPLAFYSEPSFRLPFLLPGAGGMPQTVLLDSQGQIRAWKTGAADWSSPEARRLVEALRRETR